MGCFSFFKNDPSKADIKTAKKISLHDEEDRKARQKRVEDEQIEYDWAVKESLELAEQEEAKRRLLEKSNKKGKSKQVEDKGQTKHSKDHVEKKDVNPPPPSICNGCNSAIEDGISVSAFDVLWHPLCLCCLHCHKPIDLNEIPNSKGQCHRPCYKEHSHPKCYVCEKKIPLTPKGIEYKMHPFWEEKYCPSHDFDGTPKCCSCERLESGGTKYVNLEDGRWLCVKCMESAVMNTDECALLHVEIRDFFEDLHMKIEQQFPLLLVEKKALNKAEEEEKIDNHYGMLTRGICLSEEQMVTSVSEVRGPRMGPNNQLILERVPKSEMLLRKCEVTAILILYGLPRFLTGYILAHEMMHAYLRLNGYGNLNNVLEEGLCQMLGHMWLEPQAYATPDVVAAADASSASSSSSRNPPATTKSKKGEPSEYEKKLVKFCLNQIETDESPDYGDGFRKVNKMMASNHNILKDTLKEIVSISKTTPHSKS